MAYIPEIPVMIFIYYMIYYYIYTGLTLVQDSIRRIKKQKRKRKEVVTSLVREQLKGNDEVFENEESKV